METATPTEVFEEKTVPVPAQTNAALVFGLLTDFATINDQRLREAIEWRGHSVWQDDEGLWFSCCKPKTCHESREEAEKCCAGGFCLELADEVQP